MPYFERIDVCGRIVWNSRSIPNGFYIFKIRATKHQENWLAAVVN